MFGGKNNVQRSTPQRIAPAIETGCGQVTRAPPTRSTPQRIAPAIETPGTQLEQRNDSAAPPKESPLRLKHFEANKVDGQWSSSTPQRIAPAIETLNGENGTKKYRGSTPQRIAPAIETRDGCQFHWRVR